MGLITLMLGVLGLLGILVQSLGSLSLLIIGSIIILMPIRSMFLALVVQSGGVLVQLVTTLLIMPDSELTICFLPTAAGLIALELVLFFRYKNAESKYIESMMDRDLSSISLEQRAGQLLPWITLVVGIIALASFVAAIIIGTGMPIDSLKERIWTLNFDDSYMLASTLAYALGITGIAFGFSSLVNSRKGAVKGSIGVLCSGIVLLPTLVGIVFLW